jgi:hypothetical protein
MPDPKKFPLETGKPLLGVRLHNAAVKRGKGE